MTRIRLLLLGLVVLCGAYSLCGGKGFSAEITRINGSCFISGENCKDAPTAILIDGVIEKGDAKKFAEQVFQMERQQNSFQVLLRSPGGSVYEAMEIGGLIRRLMLDTFGPFPTNGRPYCPEVDNFPGRARSCVCASACFLIYAGGVPRNMAYLLLHRPYVDPVANARLDVDKSATLVAKMRVDVGAYLRRMEVPRDYVETMFATPSNSAVPIDHDAMRDRIAGYPSAIEEWLMAQCRITTFGQNMAQFEAENAAGGGPEFLADFQRRDKARNACIEGALDPKRTAAAQVWSREFMQQRAAESAPRPAASPVLPPGYRLVSPEEAKDWRVAPGRAGK